MAKRYNMFPSGPRKKLVKGIFNRHEARDHAMQPAVRRALDEAYSGPPRKNGAPHTKG